MGWFRDRIKARFGLVEPETLSEALERRRDGVDEDRAAAESLAKEAGPIGFGLDADDGQFRRLSDGSKARMRRDLTLVQQDRALNVSWLLVETNSMAKRVLELMRDLVVGEGVELSGRDERTADPLKSIWRAIMGGSEIGDLYYAASLNGELILPVTRNSISGAPRIGFIDPLSVLKVEFDPVDVRQAVAVYLKRQGSDLSDGQRLEVIREDPETGKLIDGDVFFWRINSLPNSGRGRPDLLTLADYIDLYDQMLYGNAESQRALSSFVWDYEIDTTDEAVIERKVRELGKPKSGQVFGHNKKEKLEAITPDIKAPDRSESVKMLATHVAGGMGYPLTWLGYPDSTRATLEGQNDVAMKTPKRRQNQFKRFLELMVRYGIEGMVAANPAYYRGRDLGFSIEMPEIATKDVSRAGGVLSGVIQGLDAAMANETISRRAAVVITMAIVRHLGVEMSVDDVMAQIEDERSDRAESEAERAASVARANAEKAQSAGD